MLCHDWHNMRRRTDGFKHIRGPYQGKMKDGEYVASPWTLNVIFLDGRRSSRGFPTREEAEDFMREHGFPVAGDPKPQAAPRPPPARAPTFPLSAIAEPSSTDGPAFWIGLLTQTALEVSASPSDPLKRGRVLASLATAARGHQDQAELARKVTAMEAAFADMQTAEDYGTATGPSGAYSDSGDAPQSDRALS